jgi:hypothetical protein
MPAARPYSLEGYKHIVTKKLQKWDIIDEVFLQYGKMQNSMFEKRRCVRHKKLKGNTY